MQIVFTCSGAAAQHSTILYWSFVILYVVLSCAMLLLNTSVHGFSYNLLRFIIFSSIQLQPIEVHHFLHLSSWVQQQPIEVHNFSSMQLQPIEVHQF